MAYKAIGKLLEIVKVCTVTNNDVLIAFQKKAKDLEEQRTMLSCTGTVGP